MRIFNKLLQKLNTARKLLFFNKADKNFYQYSRAKWNTPRHAEGELLVDQMFYDLYIFQLAYITNYFRDKYNLDAKHYHLISRERKSLNIFFKFFRKYSRIDKLYDSFGCSFGFGQKYYKESSDIIKRLKFSSKWELLNFEIDGIRIGDLIYDTYLRMYSRPTVDLVDERLYQITKNAFDIYFSCKDYLDTHQVKKVVLSHAVYIQYGILARLALARGIDVYNFPWERVAHRLTADHPLPTLRHLEYPSLFKEIKDKDKCREEAKMILSKRLNGEIDRGIAYMGTSPYENKVSEDNIFLNNGKPKVVLMLHCFYDAPHIYKNMIFEDFYEWVEFVLSRVDQMDVDFVMKPHPNGKPYNKDIIDGLLEKYPGIRVTSKKISNKQIISEGVDVLLTVYGTVAHEFAYQGVTVITSGDNPSAAYKFCLTPKTKEEFEDLLFNIADIKIDISKKEIEEFFYMHYLRVGSGRIEGNNDLFHVRTRDFDPSNNNMFNELVADAKIGKFDCVYDSFSESLDQIDV